MRVRRGVIVMTQARVDAAALRTCGWWPGFVAGEFSQGRSIDGGCEWSACGVQRAYW